MTTKQTPILPSASVSAGEAAPVNDDPQLTFTYAPAVRAPRTRAQRLAAGELRPVTTEAAPRGGGWSLAVTTRLWADVGRVPSYFRHQESAPRRWHDVLLLAAAAVPRVRASAAARGEDGGRGEAEFKVILRTSAASEKAHEHLKTLRLVLEWEPGAGGGGWRECFTLGYADEAP